MPPLRLVVADDTLVVREGVRSLLDDQPDMDVVATAGDLDGLLSAVAEHRPDVVVTDVCMPPTRTDEGIRAAQAIRADFPDIGVVVLSQYDDPAYATGLLEKGWPDGPTFSRTASASLASSSPRCGPSRTAGR